MNIVKKEAFRAKRLAREEFSDIENIFSRLLRGDFSGNTGQAIKNSGWQLSATFIAKIGSLAFTWIILMRMLSQELFGLYSLALSTILIFAGFTDLGIGSAIVRYIAKKKEKSRGHIIYLIKLKTILTIVVSLILIIFSKAIANYYGKPIFIALMAGVIYIFSTNLLGFIEGIYKAEENFKKPFFKEVIFQVLRLILVPITIVIFFSISEDIAVAKILIAVSIGYLLSTIFMLVGMKRYSGKKLTKSEKGEVNNFILPLSATVLSGVFFGYIDTVMLGRFVPSEFIAYYQAAFPLITSAMVLISFSIVLFPMFSRMKDAQLERGFRKSILITALMGIFAVVIAVLIAPYLIQFMNFVVDKNYNPSINILKILSIILFTDPLIGIYTSYYTSQGRTMKIAKSVIASTIVNISLNLLFIIILIPHGPERVVLGVAIATSLSRIVYLLILSFGRNKVPKSKNK